MNRTRIWLIAMLCMCLMLAVVAKIFAESGKDESNISIHVGPYYILERIKRLKPIPIGYD